MKSANFAWLSNAEENTHVNILVANPRRSLSFRMSAVTNVKDFVTVIIVFVQM